jgi:hypothetical protein
LAPASASSSPAFAGSGWRFELFLQKDVNPTGRWNWLAGNSELRNRNTLYSGSRNISSCWRKKEGARSGEGERTTTLEPRGVAVEAAMLIEANTELSKLRS